MTKEPFLDWKYRVIEHKTGNEVKDFFLLFPAVDPIARVALKAYAQTTPNKLIARYIIHWLELLDDAGMNEKEKEPKGKHAK